ncbi:MAG: hypothetical protein ACRBFS_15455 [Aureispira sp.]
MLETIKNQLPVFLMTVLLVLLVNYGVDAQCPMCRMSAETNLKSGGTAAAGLNKGIIYLLIGPYIMMSTVAFLWWRNRRAFKAQEQEEAIQALLEPHDVIVRRSLEEQVG